MCLIEYMIIIPEGSVSMMSLELPSVINSAFFEMWLNCLDTFTVYKIEHVLEKVIRNYFSKVNHDSCVKERILSNHEIVLSLKTNKG